MLKRSLYIALALFLVSSVGFADDAGLHYPHYDINNIGCFSCHYHASEDPPEWFIHVPQDLDDTPYNNLCRSCHNDIVAPHAEPHSSLTTSTQYGDWAIECRSCHWPHHQYQSIAFGSASYIYSGVSSDVTTTTLTKAGAGWTDGQHNGYILITNVNQPSYSYLITNTTSDTLTVETTGTHPEPIDLTRTAAGNTFAIIYGKLIRPYIPTPSSGYKLVRFFHDSGPNSFVDSDSTHDGVCEVCHTETKHFRNTGEINAGASDYDHNEVVATNCMICHPHTAGFSHGGAAASSGSCEECHGHDPGYNGFTGGIGSYVTHSTHTENDEDDLKGPNVSCDACHDTNIPYFKSGTDSNGDGLFTLAETDVCNACHSPGGTYDGINDAVVGAKNNWHTAIYEPDSVTLQSGKDKWCATCHDEDPAVIQSIAAPNAVGDESGAYTYGTGWGFYKTGHGLDAATTYPASGGLSIGAGKECLDCHDVSFGHIDGDIRTYSSGSNNYQAGYRLKSIDGVEPMNIPHTSGTDLDPDNYALCFSCHDSNRYLLTTPAPVITGFRDDENIAPNSGGDVPVNAHEYHLNFNGLRFDSDWEGTYDSIIACVTCHNVHGSTQHSMVRDGKLVGREPGMVMYYDNVLISPNTYSASAPDPADVTLAASTGTIFLASTPANICSHCHGGNYLKYYRSPPSAPAAPTLAWTGETGYETDGVIPDNAQSGSYFSFRVEYTDANYDLPATIQVWVDADDSGSYEDGEKFDLFEADSSDGDCSDGKLYANVMVVNFAGDGTLNYRFHAADRFGEATGNPVTGGTITLTSSTPLLAWSGPEGYIADGVNPNSGASGSSFVFGIDYSHGDNVSPTSIQVWVDIDDNGSYEPGEKYELTEVDSGDTTYTDGKLYSRALALAYAGDGSLNYRFYATDGAVDAIGTPTVDLSLIVTNSNTEPVLAWTGADNYITDGVDPDTGIDNTSFNFQVQYSDAENSAPTSIQVWVDKNDDDDYDDSGEKIDLTAVDATDNDYSDGKIYAAMMNLAVAGDGLLNYRFSASDGTVDATGTPANGSIVTLLVNAINVSCYGTGDYDYTSLQAAIDDAANGDTILLASGTCTENITIDNKDLTIVSVNGPGSTFIDGNASGTVVKIINGSDMVLNGVTVQNGSLAVGYGGGISISDSSPTILNSIVTGNTSQYGGGLNVSGGSSTVTISETTVSSNTTTLSGSGIYLASGSSADISGSTISNNSSGGHGGGIYMTTSVDASLTISASTISSNSIASSAEGGGIFCLATGGTVSLSIDDTTISGHNGLQYGGAIYVENNGATLTGTINDSTISSNATTLTGGGLYLDGVDSMTISGSTFNNNSSVAGAAIRVLNEVGNTLTIIDSFIRDNTGFASSTGGGLKVSGGTVTIERCYITGNSARWGGGVYIEGNTTASFINCVVTGNFSYEFAGGGFYISGQDAVMVADIVNCTISGNNTLASGGGVEVVYDATATVTVTNSIIYDNGGSSEINGTVTATYSDIGEDGYSGNNNINVDPWFVDPRSSSSAPTSEGDYHLPVNSQAVNAGTSVGAPFVDIDGDIRPSGADVDMGADEVKTVLNSSPSLEWTGETGYAADGVNPDQGVSGASFEFRITYVDADNDAPSVIQLWVDENDNGSYEVGEKYTMSAIDGGDTTYSDGKLYTKSLNLVYAGDDVLNYRFYAADNNDFATGDPVADSTVFLNSIPQLAWVGSGDYVADGANPDSGLAGSDFVFRVTYTDAHNTPPTSIQVWVDRNDDGDYVDSGEMLSMTALNSADTDYTDGMIYTRVVALTKAGDNTLDYRFYAANGVVATGDPATTTSTVTLINNIPTLTWTGLTNYTEDGVDPDYSLSTTLYDFQVKYTDADNEAPTAIQLWLDKNDNGNYDDAGEKLDMVPVDPGDSTYSDGKLYKVEINLDAAGDGFLNYSFIAGDGTDTATGTPTSDSTVGVFAANPPPDLDWTGESSYTVDGVDPDSGPGGGVYTFRVQYTQFLDNAPSVIQLWVDKNGNGNYLDAGEKIDLSAVDGDDTTYSDGKLYTVATIVPYVAGGSVSYLFYAHDGTDAATGNATAADTVTVFDAQEVPTEFGTIQAAIDAAGDGGYVLVDDGTYDENIVFPTDKSITVQSVHGAGLTTIQGSGANAAVVTIGSGDSYSPVLDGFTIDNQLASTVTRGIYVFNLSAPLIKNSIIQGNTSTSGSAGGLYLNGASSTNATTLLNTTVTGNTVGGSGGGIFCANSKLDMSNSIVSNNTSTFDGTGLYLSGSLTTVTISNSTLTGNQGRSGVALYATGIGDLTISDTTIDANTATATGAGLYVNAMAGTTTVTNVSVTNNTSGSSAGGIFFSSVGTSLSITDSTIDNNTVTLYDGGGLYLSGDATTTATLTGGSVSGNVARNGSGIFILNGPSLVADGVEISGNQGTAAGGGISVGGGCSLDISRSYIRGNRTASYGGGITNGGTVTLTNCIVSGNVADLTTYSDGGGIYSPGTLNVYNSTISGNYAKRYGGGLSGSATIINSIIWGNSADGSGTNISGTPTITYSDVQDGYAGTGNIDANPWFVDFQQAGLGSPTSAGIFLLCNGADEPAGCTKVSPCIDSASATSAPGDDIEGDSRPYDVETTGDGVAEYDMGADEYVP